MPDSACVRLPLPTIETASHPSAVVCRSWSSRTMEPRRAGSQKFGLQAAWATVVFEHRLRILSKNLETGTTWRRCRDAAPDNTVCEEVTNMTQITMTFHCVTRPLTRKTTLYQGSSHAFLDTAGCSFDNTVRTGAMRSRCVASPPKLLTGFDECLTNV